MDSLSARSSIFSLVFSFVVFDVAEKLKFPTQLVVLVGIAVFVQVHYLSGDPRVQNIPLPSVPSPPQDIPFYFEEALALQASISLPTLCNELSIAVLPSPEGSWKENN